MRAEAEKPSDGRDQWYGTQGHVHLGHLSLFLKSEGVISVVKL